MMGTPSEFWQCLTLKFQTDALPEFLVMTGGKERTEAEFRQLYEPSGFKLTRIVATESPFSVIEGVRV